MAIEDQILVINEELNDINEEIIEINQKIDDVTTEVESIRPDYIRVVSGPNGAIGYIAPKSNETIWNREEVITPPRLSVHVATQNHKVQLSNHIFRYPYDRCTPAGTYAFSNAIVSGDQKYGVWSEETIQTVKSGWFLYGGCWNQPSRTDDVGIVWRVRCIDVANPIAGLIETGREFLVYPNLYWHKQITPYDFCTPTIKYLNTLDFWWVYTLDKLRSGGRATTVAPAPIVVCSSIPNKPFQLAYCRVTETGETELSVPTEFIPSLVPAEYEVAETMQFTTWQNEPHPQGTLGLHYYIKFGDDVEGGGQWRRLPAEHCYGVPERADDWLFPLQNFQTRQKRYLPDAPIHQAVPQPKSMVTGLHLALKDRAESIVIEAKDIIINCPVIDEWGYGETGSNGYPSKLNNRIISTKGGQRCNIKQANGLNNTYWPMLMVYNQYSTWENVTVSGTGCAGLAFSDYSGGQGFGNKFINCGFYAQSNPAGLTCGVIVDYAQAAAGHTASEQYFEGCRIGGDIGLWLAGNQSANWRMHYTHVNGGYRYGRRHAAIYSDCGNQISFTGGLFFDSGDSIFKSWGLGLNTVIDYFWVDGGFSHFIYGGNSGVKFTANGGKLNCWGNDGGIPNLATFVDCQYASLNMSNIIIQGASSLNVSNHRPRATELLFNNTVLADVVGFKQPTGWEYEAEFLKFYGYAYTGGYPNEPGYRLITPSSVVKTTPKTITVKDISIPIEINGAEQIITLPTFDITVPPLDVSVPSTEIVYNSLTAGKKLRRVGWIK